MTSLKCEVLELSKMIISCQVLSALEVYERMYIVHTGLCRLAHGFSLLCNSCKVVRSSQS